MAYSKGQGQDRAHFCCEHLVNETDLEMYAKVVKKKVRYILSIVIFTIDLGPV